MSVDQRAVVAANNNADLYEAMFSSQGLNYKRLPFAFVGSDSPPPYYSNLTALSPNHVDDIVLQINALVKQFDGAIILKDSFCQLNIEANGFDILFGASWIWRKPDTQTTSSNWQPVKNEADLLLWEKAWKKSGSATQSRMFNVEMLERPEIFFLGHENHGEFEAGCIANKSGDCIGISNIFSRSPSDFVFAQAAAAVASISPHMPIVGYESGEALDYAQMTGFSTVGDLRILVAKAATFCGLGHRRDGR